MKLTEVLERSRNDLRVKEGRTMCFCCLFASVDFSSSEINSRTLTMKDIVITAHHCTAACRRRVGWRDRVSSCLSAYETCERRRQAPAADEPTETPSASDDPTPWMQTDSDLLVPHDVSLDAAEVNALITTSAASPVAHSSVLTSRWRHPHGLINTTRTLQTSRHYCPPTQEWRITSTGLITSILSARMKPKSIHCSRFSCIPASHTSLKYYIHSSIQLL